MAPLEQLESRRTAVVVGDLVFDALACGPDDGELVVLLHGFPQTETMWSPVLESLGSSGWRAVAPRQRGYAAGARPPDRAAYRIDELVDDVVGIAAALGEERFHLVGHDWGALVGWTVAARHPERIRSFSSLATPHPAAIARSMVGTQAMRSAYAGFFRVPVLPERILGTGNRTLLRLMLERSGLPPVVARRTARELDGAALHAALEWYRASSVLRLAEVDAVQVPTLFVWGNADVALGRAAAEATADFVLGPYRFEELSSPHWLVETHPGDVAALIAAHLRGNRDR